MKIKAKIIVLFILFMNVFIDTNRGQIMIEKHQAEKIKVANLDNLYKVSEDIYRSEQPTKQAMQELEQMGICTILNLRKLHNDQDEAKATHLQLERVPIVTSKLTYLDIVTALQIIKTAKKPLLVHCWHGSDRTGCIIAAYRMVFENWTREEAIQEFKNKAFGYHKTWFPSILNILNNIEIEKLKADVFATSR